MMGIPSMSVAHALHGGLSLVEVMPQSFNLGWDKLPEVLMCSVALFSSGILCSAGGVGGGGVFVAVLMVAGGLSPRDAVPLSKAIVFFGSIASLVVNLKKQQQVPANSVIDLSACKMVVPAALGGTFFGVLMNWHAHDMVVLMALAIMLAVMAALVLREACRQHQEESMGTRISCGSLHGGDDGDHTADPELAPLVAKQKEKAAPEEATTQDMVVSGSLLLAVITCGVLRFHMLWCDVSHSGLPPDMCALGTWVGLLMMDPSRARSLHCAVIAIPIVFCTSVAAYYTRQVLSQGRGWNLKRCLLFQSTSAVTGVLAGLVGIGGGLVFSPFFLLMGMDPAVAVGTSTTCVLFTSSSTTMQYLFANRIVVSLAIVYGLVTLASSACGTVLVHHIRDRFPHRKSYISMLVAFTVVLSIALVFVKIVGVVMSLGTTMPHHAVKMVVTTFVPTTGEDDEE